MKSKSYTAPIHSICSLPVSRPPVSRSTQRFDPAPLRRTCWTSWKHNVPLLGGPEARGWSEALLPFTSAGSCVRCTELAIRSIECASSKKYGSPRRYSDRPSMRRFDRQPCNNLTCVLRKLPTPMPNVRTGAPFRPLIPIVMGQAVRRTVRARRPTTPSPASRRSVDCSRRSAHSSGS